jgi:hypothetical protein
MMDCSLARLLRVVVKPIALSRWASLDTHYLKFSRGKIITAASPFSLLSSETHPKPAPPINGYFSLSGLRATRPV